MLTFTCWLILVHHTAITTSSIRTYTRFKILLLFWMRQIALVSIVYRVFCLEISVNEGVIWVTGELYHTMVKIIIRFQWLLLINYVIYNFICLQLSGLLLFTLYLLTSLPTRVSHFLWAAMHPELRLLVMSGPDYQAALPSAAWMGSLSSQKWAWTTMADTNVVQVQYCQMAESTPLWMISPIYKS